MRQGGFRELKDVEEGWDIECKEKSVRNKEEANLFKVMLRNLDFFFP